jgi:DNA helicase-2/ATP-dependent DNA helicase PcrA
MTEDLISGLNPQQREAVTAGEGPTLVLAGPGSGKTRVLTHRIAYLIREARVPLGSLMAVTFTNKAASEMRARIEKLLEGQADGLTIGTFHSICSRLLRREAEHTPYGRDYAIYDTDDQQTLMKQVAAELNVDVKKYNPGRILYAISAAKNELITPDEYQATDYFGEIVRRAYPRYQALLQQNNAMDFDDLLMQMVVLLRDNESVRQKYQRRYEYILVDEFQDTNTAQYQLVRLLGKPQDNVFVVGDEDQGIYAFRGADFRNVLRFREDYPTCRAILLEQNYRSTQVVLDAARAVIDKNRNRTPKALFTERQGGLRVAVYEAYSETEEGDYVASKILDMQRKEQLAFRDFAVMYRTNAQSRALEDALVARGVPYRLVGGVGFYKRKEVKDLLAFMRLVNNPDDTVSFERVINVPGRGIGDKSLENFRAWLHNRGGSTLEALRALANGAESPLKGKALKGFSDFAQMLTQWRGLLDAGNDLLALFDAISADTKYNLYIHEISDRDEQAQERRENVKELRALVEQKRDLALEDFLAEVALVADVDTLTVDSDTVTLLTLHAAKGLEYPVVFICGLEEDLLPHSRSKDDPEQMAEERRLFYVGITRAENQLFLTYTFRRMIYGDNSPRLPSRFLADIPTHLTDGAPTKVSTMQDRDAYQRVTTWDSGSSANRQKAAAKGKSKIIPFAQESAKPLKYKTGLRVSHAKFGVGIVVESARYGDDEEVTVAFEQFGIKKLASSFANLVILKS